MLYSKREFVYWPLDGEGRPTWDRPRFCTQVHASVSLVSFNQDIGGHDVVRLGHENVVINREAFGGLITNILGYNRRRKEGRKSQ